MFVKYDHLSLTTFPSKHKKSLSVSLPSIFYNLDDILNPSISLNMTWFIRSNSNFGREID